MSRAMSRHRAGRARTSSRGPSDPSLAYLFGRLSLSSAACGPPSTRRRAVDADPEDRFRGLYISDEQVDGLLDRAAGPLAPVPGRTRRRSRPWHDLEARAAEAERAGADVRLRDLARAFDLEPADVELLLVALAPDLDPRFERLYGYLHDDVSRRRASVGLALELCGSSATPGAGPIRDRLGPLAPLLAGRLLHRGGGRPPVAHPAAARPGPGRRAPARRRQPRPVVEALLTPSIPVELDEVDAVARGLAAGLSLVYLRERPGASGHSLGLTALARLGRPAIVLDLARLTAGRRARGDRGGGVARGAPARRRPRRRAGRAARRARRGRRAVRSRSSRAR